MSSPASRISISLEAINCSRSNRLISRAMRSFIWPSCNCSCKSARLSALFARKLVTEICSISAAARSSRIASSPVPNRVSSASFLSFTPIPARPMISSNDVRLSSSESPPNPNASSKLNLLASKFSFLMPRSSLRACAFSCTESSLSAMVASKSNRFLSNSMRDRTSRIASVSSPSNVPVIWASLSLSSARALKSSMSNARSSRIILSSATSAARPPNRISSRETTKSNNCWVVEMRVCCSSIASLALLRLIFSNNCNVSRNSLRYFSPTVSSASINSLARAFSNSPP